MSKAEILSANIGDLARGSIGVGAVVLANITPQMMQTEYALRCMGYITSIAVGVVTIWSMIKRSRNL